MKLKLVTFEECCENIGMFEDWDCDSANGKFVLRKIGNNMPICFEWICDGEFHRLDGPARVFNDTVEWHFLDCWVKANSQSEFDEWVARKMLEV